MSRSSTDPPAEFELPERLVSVQLALLRAAALGEPQREPRLRPRTRRVVLVAMLLLIAVTAIAAAASQGLFDRDVTLADIEARSTLTTRFRQECTAPGVCEPGRFETVSVNELLPSDGVTFVDPDGKLISLIPGAGTLGFESDSDYGRQLSATRMFDGTRHLVTLQLPGGASRTIAWKTGQGTVTVTDRQPDGTTSTKQLLSGDVVPLLPGTLTDQPLTPDKAVTFDLAHGDYPVWVYPQRNQAYVGGLPWRNDLTPVELPTDLVDHYRLVRLPDGRYSLPIDSSGGSWSYTLDDGTTRTVSWRAGADGVLVSDTDASGGPVGEEHLPIGRRVNSG